MEIYVPHALRLHALGLRRLVDPEWTGTTLYYHLKRYARGQVRGSDVLYKTVPDGVLVLLGGWLYDEYLDPDRVGFELGGEQLFWHIEDVIEFLCRLPNAHLDVISVLVREAEDNAAGVI